MNEKRESIISKAVDLYHQYGIKSVSMDDIAREMGMSKKTLYQYVNDKNDLVNCVVDHHIELITELFFVFTNNAYNAIEQHWIHAKNVMERFPRYNPSMLYDLRKYYPMQLNKLNEHKFKESYQANFQNLEKGKQEGFYRSEINSHIIAKILISYQQYLFDPSNGLLTDNELADKQTHETVYQYHFRGVCTTEGLKELKRLFIDNK